MFRAHTNPKLWVSVNAIIVLDVCRITELRKKNSSVPPPPTRGRHIVFGSVVVVCVMVVIVVVVVYVIPCEHDNFGGALNFIFKIEPCIDHIKVLDEFETGDLDLDLQGQIGLETSKILVLFFFN